MTANECRRCARPADLYICPTCITNLRKQLRELPWWLDRLIETAVGQARLHDGGGKRQPRNILHGDDPLAAHIEPYPDDDEQDLARARKQRQHAALRHALAAVGANPRAGDEHNRITNLLTTWIRDTCQTRGITEPHITRPAIMACWLATHANDIATTEAAGQLCDDIAATHKRIQRIVNRPIPPRFIGPCITDPAPEPVLTSRQEAGDQQTRCNHALTAHRDAKHVTCPQCEQTHDVDTLTEKLYNESGDTVMTVRDLVDHVLPRIGEPIPERTLHRWITTGDIPTRGYTPTGERLVRLADVRAIRRSRPRHATG